MIKRAKDCSKKTKACPRNELRRNERRRIVSRINQPYEFNHNTKSLNSSGHAGIGKTGQQERGHACGVGGCNVVAASSRGEL